MPCDRPQGITPLAGDCDRFADGDASALAGYRSPVTGHGSWQRVPVHDTAADVGERMLDDERGRIEAIDDAHDAADLQPGHDAVDHLAILAALAAAGLVDGDAAAEIAEQRALDRGARVRHDGDRGELLDAVQDELERA